MNNLKGTARRLGVDIHLMKFLTDVKFLTTMGFYGKDLERHLSDDKNEQTLKLILEFRRGELTNV